MSETRLSLDQVLAPVEPKASSAKSPTRLSLDDVLAPVPQNAEVKTPEVPAPSAEGKILDNNNVDDPWYKWVPKKVATAAAKGISHIPGIFGDVGDMADMGLAAADVGGRSVLRAAGVNVQPKSINQSMQDIRQARDKTAILPQPPSSSQIYNATVAPVAGEYVSSTPLGRMGDAALEAVLTPNIFGKGKILKETAQYALPNAVAGAAAQGTAEATDNPLLATAVGAAAGIPAAKVQNVATTYAGKVATAKGRDQSAKELASKVYQESAVDPQKAAANLDDATRDPGLPGYQSTTVGRADDTGVSALEGRLRKGAEHIENADGVPYNQQVEQQNAANRAAFENAADDLKEGVRQSGQSGAMGQSGVTGRTEGDVSSRASSLREAAENASKSNINTLWSDFDQAGGKLYANRVVQKLTDLRESMKPSDRALVDKDLQLAIEDLQFAQTGKTTGVRALQDARSAILSKARDAGAKQDFTLQNKLNDVAKSMGDIMGDKSNYLFGDRQDVAGKWQAAVDATRDHHQTWDTQSLARQRAVDKAGELKVDPHEMLRDTFAGRNAAQKTQQLIHAVGSDPALMRQAQDWHVSDLTDGGTRVPKPAQIDKYMADHAQVIDQIPGLRDRLTNYRNLSHTDMVMENFNIAATDPSKFVRFMEKNRKDVAEVGQRTGQSDLFNKLELAARELSAKTAGKPVNTATLDKISQGRMISLMYGTMTETLGTGLTGVLAAKLLSSPLGHGAESSLAVVGGAAGAGGHRGFHNLMNSTLGKAMTRDIQERTIKLLQESRTNPALAKELMQGVTPQGIQKLYGGIPSLTAAREALDAQDERGGNITVSKPAPRE